MLAEPKMDSMIGCHAMRGLSKKEGSALGSNPKVISWMNDEESHLKKVIAVGRIRTCDPMGN